MNIASGTLFVVGTPIGNLDDLSPRAIEVLTAMDCIAAEDTRVTRKLLSRYDIHVPLVSYYEHNKTDSGGKLIAKLQEGQRIALVSDAGMPAISDPGQELVARCAEAGIPVVVVPGPSACVSALAISGLPSGRFCFEGFLSTAKQSRREHLSALTAETRTMIFYEAPHKLRATLKDMYDHFGERRIALCRELTKLHEEVLRTTFLGAMAHFAEAAPRGEFVLVIEGATAAAMAEAIDGVALARQYVQEGISVRDAARRAATESGQPKSEIYRQLVQSADEQVKGEVE